MTKKIRIIFVTEKWVDVSPIRGISNSFHNLFGSLESTGLAEFECMHYDEYASTHNGNRIDNYLLYRCHNYKPDVCFFSYCRLTPLGVMLDETIEKIKTMGIKTIFIWWDGMTWLNQSSKQMMITYDNPYNIDGALHTEHTPQDPRIYNDPECERNIDVYFCGTLYDDRPYFIDYVTTRLTRNIRFKIGSGQHSDYNWSIEYYANMFKKSKISLNFCTGEQVKGRVYEAMHCGSLLVEQDNDRIKSYFEPFVHYVPFGSQNDLLEKIVYYLSSENERIQIAQAGKKKCLKDYNATIWWKKVLEPVYQR